MSSAVPVGLYRTYARLDEEFSYEAWCRAVRSGRTFLSGGPLVTLSQVRLPGNSGGEDRCNDRIQTPDCAGYAGRRSRASAHRDEGRRTAQVSRVGFACGPQGGMIDVRRIWMGTLCFSGRTPPESAEEDGKPAQEG